MPTVSVIIPCFNYGHLLPETLSSLLAQTFPDWEGIVIDDGSTDNTSEVAKEFVKKDPRFRYHYQTNAGLSAARNTGLDLATGEFIQFLDADDYLFPTKFERQLENCQTNKSDISICDYHKSEFENLFTLTPENIHRIHLNREYPLLDLFFNWERTLSIPCHCFFIRRSLLIKGNLRFNTSLPNHEDIDLWLRLFSENPSFSIVHDVLAVYRKTPGGMTKNIKKMRAGYTEVLTNLNIPQTKDANFQKLLARKINLVNRKVAFKSTFLASVFYHIQKITGPSVINRFLLGDLPRNIR
ncbi:MAG: glycosyltransferase family 2 protein [Bacteroidetes bacterium]|nr:glycosyltransferase family 2 protein [Bacteroidota bacterium]